MTFRDTVDLYCVCEHCKPTVFYTKQIWRDNFHRCPRCGHAMNFNSELPDGREETYEIELVKVTDFKVGDYIGIVTGFYKITSINFDYSRKNHILIFMDVFGSYSYSTDIRTYRLIEQ